MNNTNWSAIEKVNFAIEEIGLLSKLLISEVAFRRSSKRAEFIINRINQSYEDWCKSEQQFSADQRSAFYAE